MPRIIDSLRSTIKLQTISPRCCKAAAHHAGLVEFKLLLSPHDEKIFDARAPRLPRFIEEMKHWIKTMFNQRDAG